MLQLQKVLRGNTVVALVRVTTNALNRNFCKDYDSSDDEKELKKKKKSNEKKVETKGGEETAAAKLNRLLASMQTEGSLSLSKKVNMAMPGDGTKKKKEMARKEQDNKDIKNAAKNVAAMLGKTEEGKKQAESELLGKLLGYKMENESNKENNTDASGKPIESMNLSEIIVGMKIDRSKDPSNYSRAEFVRRVLASRPGQSQSTTNAKQKRAPRREPEAYTGSVNLFGGERLGIFTEKDKLKPTEDICKTWAHLHERELQMQIERPPSNYFEKIALWTEQGKVWRFPIDNEQDWTEEADVDFTEHIFLEQHLEPWCPTKGPIRHFMELVCVGLSKNPYITAKEKKDHILWYRDYFLAKKDILQELIDEKKFTQSIEQSGNSSKHVEA